MTVAERTRAAARRNPFLVEALRAGAVNYAAAARFLDVDGETEAVVAALRRYAEELNEYEPPTTSAPVSMQSGFGEGDPEDAMLVVGDLALVPDAGSLTALVARDGAGPAHLRAALGALDAADVEVEAAAVGGGTITAVVGRRDGPDALRILEETIGRDRP
ncbi:DUF7523 family protein [Halomicrobium salinisoli]|uniref:DUF7523 family protein n=1 Tax=Halomicrobium salinisoli TaxID=2878391 RepID=UPI001CF00C74|nr:hypothetical protein [Halomicrobium salinisoli]